MKINGLTIHEEYFFLNEYYFFSLRHREWLINKSQMLNLQLYSHNEVEYSPDSGTWLDLIIIPALFMSGKKGMVIKELIVGNKTKNKRVFLNSKEFSLISNR